MLLNEWSIRAPRAAWARYLEEVGASDWFSLGCAGAALAFALLSPALTRTDALPAELPPMPAVERPLPDLAALDAPTRKLVFFAYLRPIVEEISSAIDAERAFVLEASARVAEGKRISRDQHARLMAIASHYGVDRDALSTADVLEELVARVDTIPTSLVLVQAAKESGWGTSRFAVQGNSLFGQRCYEPGCGLAPAGRADPTFSVKSFATIEDSVRSYIHNLNTNERYADLRRARSEQRERGLALQSVELAATLTAYSERRVAYVTDIKAMIRQSGAVVHD